MNTLPKLSSRKKIDELNEQAWEMRVRDSSRAFVLSEEAVKLSRVINYPKGLAEGSRTFGFSHIRLSKHNEALQYGHEASEFIIQLPNHSS
jgi:two-component system NtrC family sensor kinase